MKRMNEYRYIDIYMGLYPGGGGGGGDYNRDKKSVSDLMDL